MSRKPKVEKVRGMNAALAATAAGGLKEREPPRLHLTRRQVAFAILLAILGVIAAIYTVDAVTSGEQTFPAVVTSSKTYDLNFANTGRVAAIMVKPGQRVAAGQVLVSQDVTALQADVANLTATVNADQAALGGAQAPSITGAQQEENILQVQQAQTALTNAKNSLASAQSSGAASVAAAQQTITADTSLMSSDSARYHQACPSGPVPPGPGLDSAQFQAAQSVFSGCLSLQTQIDKDQSTLTTDQARVPSAQASSQLAINTAQSDVNTAQSALNTAENAQALQTAPKDPASVAQAQAALSQAQSQLSQAQQALNQATLLAPDSGVISEVYGEVGEYLGANGVHQYQGPSALPSTQAPSFQLFPSQPTPNSSTGANGTQPLIELIGGQQQIMAQVPEASLSSLAVGRHASVTITALRATSPATVTEIILNPARASNAVTYDVILGLDRPVAGLLSGMSATVRPQT